MNERVLNERKGGLQMSPSKLILTLHMQLHFPLLAAKLVDGGWERLAAPLCAHQGTPTGPEKVKPLPAGLNCRPHQRLPSTPPVMSSLNQLITVYLVELHLPPQAMLLSTPAIESSLHNLWCTGSESAPPRVLTGLGIATSQALSTSASMLSGSHQNFWHPPPSFGQSMKTAMQSRRSVLGENGPERSRHGHIGWRCVGQVSQEHSRHALRQT
eukprot:874564-Pelagomonas_calceolata.AAC.1